jgi:hypothetical protein
LICLTNCILTVVVIILFDVAVSAQTTQRGELGMPVSVTRPGRLKSKLRVKLYDALQDIETHIESSLTIQGAFSEGISVKTQHFGNHLKSSFGFKLRYQIVSVAHHACRCKSSDPPGTYAPQTKNP